MKFVLNPSLEHIALVKIVTSFWNQNDVKALTAKHSFSDPDSREEWEETIKERVTKKVSQLSLPKPLKEKVLGCIKPIGLKVYWWMKYNYKYLHVNVTAELFWTPQGTVDRKRTAEVLVRDENLDISKRYKLACIYCLEDDIHTLWNYMTGDLKRSLLHKFPIVDFWSRVMKRKTFRSVAARLAKISYKNVFHLSAHENNKVAAEYLLQKLTPQERERSLVKTAKTVTDADTLCFLLAQMKEEQQLEVFENDPYTVLRCFLQWPWQSFFIKIANCMWDFLSKDYLYVLDVIICKVENGFKDCDYQMLLREFWLESPNSLKRLFIDEMDESQLLKFFFRIKDKENIALILKDITPAVKENLVYGDEMNSFVECSIRDNEWDFLQFLIQELSPSKHEMLKFKREFEMRMTCPYSRNCYLARNKQKQAMLTNFKEHFATKKQKWDEIFDFSDDSIHKCNKRGVENVKCSSSKRFDNLQ